MPRISDAKREARRTEIVDAALRCFIRTGYQRTSMADIIAESGLSAGAIYSYFPGKAELVRAVATRVIADRRGELDAAGATHPLAPGEIATILIDGIRREAPLPVLVQVWAEATIDDELRTLVQTAMTGVRGTIATALERWARTQGDATTADAGAWAAAAAPVLMSLVPGFVLQRSIIDDFDEDGFVRSIATLLPSR